MGDPSIRPDCGAAVSKDGDVGATNSVDDVVSTNLGDVGVVVAKELVVAVDPDLLVHLLTACQLA